MQRKETLIFSVNCCVINQRAALAIVSQSDCCILTVMVKTASDMRLVFFSHKKISHLYKSQNVGKMLPSSLRRWRHCCGGNHNNKHNNNFSLFTVCFLFNFFFFFFFFLHYIMLFLLLFFMHIHCCKYVTYVCTYSHM